MNFNNKTIGRCLTEYTVINYDELVITFNKFAFTHLLGPLIIRHSDKPDCRIQEEMHGVNPDGSLTKLKMIVDSSD